jgi:hypothetical protein
MNPNGFAATASFDDSDATAEALFEQRFADFQ